MTDFLLLVAARWVHFGALMIVYGSSLFQLYSFVPARMTARRLRVAALIACASAVVWVCGSIVSMTADIASLFDPATLSAFFFETSFGKAWLACMAIFAVILALVFAPGATGRRAGWRSAALAIAAASLLVVEAWLGHAASGSAIGILPPVFVYALHVAAAASWLGALPALAEVAADPTELRDVEATLWRFSTIGIICVSVVFVSGIGNVLFRISSAGNVLSTAYGRMIIVKIVLFAMLVGLAAQNRLRALPCLGKDANGRHALAVMKRNIFFEQTLAAAILLAAAVLGLLPPLG